MYIFIFHIFYLVAYQGAKAIPGGSVRAYADDYNITVAFIKKIAHAFFEITAKVRKGIGFVNIYCAFEFYIHSFRLLQ
jgi:hypothetical protein